LLGHHVDNDVNNDDEDDVDILTRDTQSVQASSKAAFNICSV